MLLAFNVFLALVGLALLVIGRIRFGRREFGPPMSSLAAVILLAPLPLSIWAYTTARAAEFMARTRPNVPPPADYTWVPLVVTLVCLALAGLVIALGFITGKDEDLPSADAPVAPSDLLQKAPRAASTAFRASASAAWNTNFPDERPPQETAPAPRHVQRVKAAGDALPEEVEALGTAEKLYRHKGLLRWLGVGVPAYVVYPGALVIAQGDDYAVVPWSLAESFDGATLKAGGEDFPISSWVNDAERLRRTVRERLAVHLAPRHVDEVREGGRATFGPMAVDGNGILYRGKRADWASVVGLDVRGNRLLIQVRGLMMPWEVHLDAVPNAHVFLEVVRELCPRRLLEPARG